MTLNKDTPPQRPGQTRGQRIAMWCIFGVAAALAIAAIIVFVASGASLF